MSSCFLLVLCILPLSLLSLISTPVRSNLNGVFGIKR